MPRNAPRRSLARLAAVALSMLLPMSPALLAGNRAGKSVTKILTQMEHDWSQADVRKDAVALNRILADDWIGIDFEGVIMTKAQVLEEVNRRSEATATESTVLGDLKIRIYGHTAIVSGTEFEKSQYRGADSSGEYVWTDVFVERNGRWQAVSSQSTKRKVGQAYSPARPSLAPQ